MAQLAEVAGDVAGLLVERAPHEVKVGAGARGVGCRAVAEHVHVDGVRVAGQAVDHGEHVDTLPRHVDEPDDAADLVVLVGSSMTIASRTGVRSRPPGST